MGIQYCEWDSNFFDLRIGKINLPAYEASISEYLEQSVSDYELIYVFQPQHGKSGRLNPVELAKYGGKIVDTKVVYEWKPVKHVGYDCADVELYKMALPTPQLRQLALQSGGFSRFYLDKGFGKKKFQSLYQKWIENSVNGDFADYVFVKRFNNEIIGFVTFKIDVVASKGNIGLIAVHPDYRGQKIGQHLMNKIKAVTLENNLISFTVPTQKNNIRACKFYKQNDLRVIERTNIYHFWLDKSKRADFDVDSKIS